LLPCLGPLIKANKFTSAKEAIYLLDDSDTESAIELLKYESKRVLDNYN